MKKAAIDNTDTIQREWHDLKGGDEVFFGADFHEVFDAYPDAQDTVVVKLRINGTIETYRCRIGPGSKATCKA